MSVRKPMSPLSTPAGVQRVCVLLATFALIMFCQLAWISHASEASARRNPEFESIINVLQEVGPRPEENSLFFGLPVRYRACAISN